MTSEEQSLAPTSKGALVVASGVDALLVTIRPAWQARSLIERVRRLVPVDPSSACQRIFNAAIHDLREKIILAGLDLAKEAAAANKLPPVTKAEDIFDSYSTSSVLDLGYRIGLLSRPDWKRLRRAYDIRRDLEHEDDEYEAQVEDCVYMFRACVEIVLSRDPIELLRVSDVKELIESPSNVTPAGQYIQDYAKAPDTRQREISEFLVSTALNPEKADLVRQNAVEALRRLEPGTRNAVRIELAKSLQERIKRRRPDLAEAKVAVAGGFLPYLKQVQVETFFKEFHERFVAAGYGWRNNSTYGPLLDDFEDVGGLALCPPAPRRDIVLWMTLCYVGEPGFHGWYGRNRPVFYSNSAAPRIEATFREVGSSLREDLVAATEDPRVKAVAKDQHVARRLERLLDLTEPK